MVPSIPPLATASRRRPGQRVLLAWLVVALSVFAGPAAAGYAASTGAPATAPMAAWAAVCSTPAPSGPMSATIPWPQARYDMAALSQISDGGGVTVAVIDSGVDSVNPQLAGAVRGGGDLLNSAGNGTEDCRGHGTAVASIIAARALPGAGLRGVAPAASVLAIRVSDRIDTENGPSGAGDINALIEGIKRAVAAKPTPKVINLSISTATDNPQLRAAIQSALDTDIVVVAAVGNQYTSGNPTPYPASYDGVVGVGAIGPTGARLPQSQVGSYVDIVAPGEQVIGALPRSGHAEFAGTSFAVPFVAGTVALIRSRWPSMSRVEVVQRLLATADPSSGGQPSADYGWGVVNPQRALTDVLGPMGAVAAGTPTPVIAPGLADANSITGPTTLALGAAAILILATIVLIGLAVATPLGRRRGWRPGTVDTSPLEKPPPGASLFQAHTLPPKLPRPRDRRSTLRR